MNTTKLTFDRDHTHAGKPVPRGAIRDIETHHADWLIDHKVAHATTSTYGIAEVQGDAAIGEHDDAE